MVTPAAIIRKLDIIQIIHRIIITQAAITMTCLRTGHIDVHDVWERVEDDTFEITHVSTVERLTNGHKKMC